MEKAIIYCLIDPNDYLVKYVGVTKRTLHERLQGHCGNTNRGNGMLLYWIKKLKKENKKPLIQALEETTPYFAAVKEKQWIRYYEKRGCYIFNIINT